MAECIPQGVAVTIPLMAYLSSDHVTPAGSLTVPITISKNGAAFGNPSVGATNATFVASGFYYVALSTTDTGTVGPLAVLGTSATIDNIMALYNVVSNVPQTGDNFARLGAPVGASISADIANIPTVVWAFVVTGTTTAVQAMRGFIAAMLGKASGLPTAPVYRNIADTKNVITATTTTDGNRTAVTLDLT